MSDENLPARRIVVKLTARDKNDPAALLLAIQNAFSPEEFDVEVRMISESEPILMGPAVVKDELLETKAREAVAAELERATSETKTKTMENNRKSARAAADIAARRQGLRAYLKFLGVEFVRMNVEIYEKTAGKAATMVSKVFNVFGGGSDEK